ncbi:hypothetical protein D3C80_1263850 [compost metagenome]
MAVWRRPSAAPTPTCCSATSCASCWRSAKAIFPMPATCCARPSGRCSCCRCPSCSTATCCNWPRRGCAWSRAIRKARWPAPSRCCASSTNSPCWRPSASTTSACAPASLRPPPRCASTGPPMPWRSCGPCWKTAGKAATTASPASVTCSSPRPCTSRASRRKPTANCSAPWPSANGWAWRNRCAHCSAANPSGRSCCEPARWKSAKPARIHH